MKKLLSMILAVTLMLALCTSAAAAEAAPIAATVQGNLGSTQKTRTTTAETVAGLWQVVQDSKLVLMKPANLADVATLDFEFAGGNTDNRRIYKDPKGILYVTAAKSSLRKIDAATFFKLADLTGIGFYKYRAIPTAKVDTTNLNISSSTYQFLKMDGQFYKTQFEAANVIPSVVGEKMQSPIFSVEPTDVKVSVKFDGAEVWSGKLADSKNYKPTKSGSYSVVYAATFDAPQYNGAVNYAYNLEYTEPSTDISFSVDNSTIDIGELLILRAKNIPQDKNITVKTNIEFKPKFFRQANGDMVSLIPISTYSQAGDYYVELQCGSDAKNLQLRLLAKSLWCKI